MIRSLLLKLGMLAVTMGIVFWIEWGVQSVQPLGFSVERQVTASSNQSIRPEPRADASEPVKIVLAPSPHLLDLNRANVHELETLPGIGAVLAQRVIAFRESLGGFRRIEDLRDVKGIGAKKFDRLKLLVTVSTSNSKGTTERRVL